MKKHITNFSPAEYFGCDGGDPESGPWADWINGRADFIDPAFAQFMWWHLCEAQMLYADMEAAQRTGIRLAAEEFDASVSQDLALIETHCHKPLKLTSPFSVESALGAIPGDDRTLPRLLLAYSIWCVDRVIDSLRCSDAKGAAAASAYVLNALNLIHEYRADFPEVQARIESQKQSERARARYAVDDKQREKRFVKECWQDWRKNPALYKSKAQFTRDMLEKCEFLESSANIEKWCRQWEKEETNHAGRLRIVPGRK
ncbi:hypothetical protein WJ32_13495 [Burkholderia ubonensis]|uniref:Exoribonuclease Xrn1 D2/D3 domain-containing protein n=1 Tax=Burkholderia ubonensis TaxID=101571 RepID=A0A103QSR8_9BURK|nr:hypothetical protein [Burkholderia ubonensis]AOJ63372.1 hypothetical protein WJ32_13495 [Burkholderia ubonensis]KVG54885.1 hypothetical protein WJ33_01055 [Burkholderia ubonensis]